MSRERLEAALGHTFSDPGLLEAALVHRSYAAEHPEVEDNERFEFLGDAVLQLVVTDYLFERFSALREGEMAKVRAACVDRVTLARVARGLGLGSEVAIGAGEEASGGREKGSILADAMEAVIAAVYRDAGLEPARAVVLRHWEDLIEEKAELPGQMDFKTRLQELLAADGRRPVYRLEDRGPDHAKVFTASLSIDGVAVAEGTGRSKKEAEQAAARAAMEAGVV